MMMESNGGVSLCAGCGQRILDRFYLLAVDRQWHNDCLKCHSCGLSLSSQLTCFARDGVILCKQDYARRYGGPNGVGGQQGRCGRCGGGIGCQELVMRAKEAVYHLNCFICVICLRVLNKGDHFGMRESALYCQQHYELVIDSETSAAGPPLSPGLNYFNGSGTGTKGRPRKRNKAEQPVDHIPANSIDLMANPETSTLRLEGYESSSSSCPGHQRTKRMRTSFKHHQLRTMKSYFALNQNPDAKDLKQLAQKTGLSKRVLQVWFQNARAKWRRNVTRSETGSVGGKSGGGSPTCPEDLHLQQEPLSGDLMHSDDGGFSSDIY